MIEIIPAIDILEGKCVRLSQGDYNQKIVYNDDPLEVAKQFEDYGIHRLHLVDLDGAKQGRVINYSILNKVASRTSLVIDFGGGIKSDTDLEIAFDNGASMVTGSSVAVKEPALFESWISKFGASHIILGADCLHQKIAVAGWTEATEEEVIPFIHKWRAKGIKKVICTDISKDGMLNGPAMELYKNILQTQWDIHLIASGGVSCLEDLVALHEAGVPGVIIGKALYEGKIRLKDLISFL